MKTLTAALALSALTLTGAAAAADNPNHTGTALVASLDGKAEVPGPGDPAGNGEFTGWFDAGKGRICYTLGVGSLASPTMAHIHQGAAQVAGPVVVPLANPTGNIAETCTDVKPELIRQIVANPSAYYVNVHTAALPKGAIRAQLSKKK